jgi:hypothetical protein
MEALGVHVYARGSLYAAKVRSLDIVAIGASAIEAAEKRRNALFTERLPAAL